MLSSACRLGDVRAWPDHKPVSLVAKDPTSKTFPVHDLPPSFGCRLRNTVANIMNAEFRGDEP